MRPYSQRENLVFNDFVLLAILADFHEDDPPTRRELYHAIWADPSSGVEAWHGGLVNEWLAAHHVPEPLVTRPIRSAVTLERHARKLKSLGLVRPGYRKSMTLSGKGRMLLQRIGTDWRRWYVRVPYDEKGTIYWDRGESVQRALATT